MTATIVLLIIAALIALSAGLLFVLPWAVHRAEKRRPWSPFGFDGRPRVDLMAVQEIDGKWHTNPQANDGFYPIGTLSLQDLSELRERDWKTR